MYYIRKNVVTLEKRNAKRMFIFSMSLQKPTETQCAIKKTKQ